MGNLGGGGAKYFFSGPKFRHYSGTSPALIGANPALIGTSPALIRIPTKF